MTPEAMVITDPRVLQVPLVQRELENWKNFDAMFDALVDRMFTGHAAIVVGTTKENDLEGAAVMALPKNFGEDSPWVIHFHNRGPRSLTAVMVKAVVDFIRAAGYTGFKALNQSGHSDKSWLRAFRAAGKPEFIGSAYLFDLKEGGPDGAYSTGRRGDGHRQHVHGGSEAAIDPNPGGHDAAGVQGAGGNDDRSIRRRNRRRPNGAKAVQRAADRTPGRKRGNGAGGNTGKRAKSA